MSVAAVIIAVSPSPPRPDLAKVLEAACTEASLPRKCEVQAGGPPPDVVVEWTAPLSARIDTRGLGPPLTRTLTFRAEDPELDVWRSVGLVAGTLATRAAAERTETAPVAPAAPPARSVRSVRELWLTGGAVLGNGLERGPVSFGGALRIGYQLPIAPIFVGAGGSYASAGRGPQGLDASSTVFSIGAGTSFTLSDLVVRPRLDLLLARLVAEATEGPGGGTSGSRQIGGAGAALELAWPHTERVAVVLGGEGSFYSGGTSIRLAETRISAFPALGYRFFLGIEAVALP